MTSPHARPDPDDNSQAPVVPDSCCDETSGQRDAAHCDHPRPRVQHVVEGDLTIYSASEQKSRLLSVFRTPYSIVELDLGRVSEIDTAGVQLLILGCRITVTVGGSLQLTNLRPQVTSILELLNLEETLERARNHCPVCADERLRNHV